MCQEHTQMTVLNRRPRGAAKHLPPRPMTKRAHHQKTSRTIARLHQDLLAEPNAAFGRPGTLAAFLVGAGAHRIRGTIIPVDGGRHLVA
jgi:hypothetical protein